MIIGECLLDGATVFSPWFARFGNAATFACEAIDVSLDMQLEIVVQTKNTEDADSAAVPVAPAGPLVENWIVNAVGTSSACYVGFKEMIRIRYAVSFEGDLGDPTGPVHFRMLPPAWEANCVDTCEEMFSHKEYA